MKKLIIFDFDGTLINSIEDAIDCINILLKKNNYPLYDYSYNKGNELNFKQIINELSLKNNITKEELISFREEFINLYHNHPKNNTIPFEGVISTLNQLQEDGFLLAINSNKSIEMINFFIDKFFKSIDFFKVTGFKKGISPKPSPKQVLNIIKDSGVDFEDVLYVGDSTTDILTAQNADIDFVLVSWGQISFNDVDDDIIIIDKPSDIFKYIF